MHYFVLFWTKKKLEYVILKQQFGGFTRNVSTINQHPLDEEWAG